MYRIGRPVRVLINWLDTARRRMGPKGAQSTVDLAVCSRAARRSRPGTGHGRQWDAPAAGDRDRSRSELVRLREFVFEDVGAGDEQGQRSLELDSDAQVFQRHGVFE